MAQPKPTDITKANLAVHLISDNNPQKNGIYD